MGEMLVGEVELTAGEKGKLMEELMEEKQEVEVVDEELQERKGRFH